MKLLIGLPTKVVHERGRAEDFEFTAQRLNNAVQALEPHHIAVLRREELAQWNTSTADIRQKIADLSQELSSVYPETVAKLVDLFKRCNAADRELAIFNSSAPSGCYLRGVEETLTNGSATKMIPKVKLPTLTASGAVVIDAWPLPTPPLGVEMYNQVLAMMRGAPPPPTDQEKIEAMKRQMAFVETQERGRVRLNEAAEARERAQEVERRRVRDGELR